ncbi:MAG: DUF2927 domain-containing protein [Rhodospirillales bacterium]|nr:DUF2927 domain-containing protein [Rhodospirillales bacterium]
MVLLRSLVVAAGMGLAGQCGAVAAENQSQPVATLGDLYRAFETVVFGNEFGSKKPRAEVLKWEQPIRVAIRAYDDVAIIHDNNITEIAFRQIPVDNFHFEVAKKHLQTLSQLTDLKLEDYAGSGQEPNLTINFVPRIHMTNPVLVYHEDVGARQLAAQNGCFFVIWKNQKTRAIDRAVIVANTDRDEKGISHCVLEELVQTLGLPNDNNVKWLSIFSDHHQITELSPADRIIVKTLYDPEIRSGMGKKEVLRKALGIIKALSKEKTGID